MLSRLRVAFEWEWAFVDDASHELRTPIAVLCGELELPLLAADDPDEQDRSLRSALSEAARLQPALGPRPGVRLAGRQCG